MKKYNLGLVFTLVALMGVIFSSCEVIGGIFKAGVWVGVIIVVIVIIIIFWLVSKIGKK